MKHLISLLTVLTLLAQPASAAITVRDKAELGVPANYILNGGFESGLSGWSLAHTALTSLFPISTASVTVPFDASHGGSAASGNLSIAYNTSSPLAGNGSLSLASSAASTAGDMLISKAFKVDPKDQSAPMTITLSSKVTVNPSNLNFSGTSSNSFAIYIYDVTAGAWIQPAGTYGMVSNGVYNVKNVVFQPQSSASTQYQLAFININASVGAYTMLLDAIGVGPQASVSAPAMDDWAPYTPTFTGFGTPSSVNCYSRRVGDSLEEQCSFTQGTTTATPAQVTLGYKGGNANVTIDSTKSNGGLYGYATVNSGGAFSLTVLGSPGNNYVQFGQQASGTAGTTAANGSSIGSGQFFTFFAKVPIVGWSSNTVSSADTATGVVAANYTNTAGTAISTTPVQVPFATLTTDTTGSFNGATGVYTVPVAGIYEVATTLTSAGLNLGTGQVFGVQLYKNGSVYRELGNTYGNGTSQTYRTSGFSQVPCVAGDTLSVYTTSSVSGTLITLAGFNHIDIKRLSGPAVVQTPETVSMRYIGSSSSISGSLAPVAFTTKTFDDHNAYSGSTFTCPISGKYLVAAAISITGTYVAGSGFIDLDIYLNGSQYSETFNYAINSADALANIVDTVYCTAGQTIQIYANSNATSPVIQGLNRTFLSITRVGN